MSALQKLIDRCNEMDITEQLEWLGDAVMPSEAKTELAAMTERIAKLEDVANELADIVQWAIDDATFLYIKEGREAIEKLEALK